MIPRDLAEQAFRRAVVACDPRARVAEALAKSSVTGRATIGIAVGKAALAMARGAGTVTRGVAVTVAPDGEPLPAGWRTLVAGHPEPDDRSIVAGQAVRALVDGATNEDIVVALISGGASSLVEWPRIPLAEFRAITSSVMAAGAPIADLNTVRGALSTIKAGQLAVACAAQIVTLVASDVIGDRLDVVGSGPTIGPWLDHPTIPVDVGVSAEQRRVAAIAILQRYGIAVPASLHTAMQSRVVARRDRAELVIAMASFAEALCGALLAVHARPFGPHFEGEVASVADQLVLGSSRAEPLVAWGEPTLRVPPDHGEGGRAQQLALELAKRLRGTDRSALVAGTDGIDGPPPHLRPAPAGAYVDGHTWDAIFAAGIDPAAALARCDAGTALHAVGALFVTGPTGINHADVAIVG